ncbi:uncharacterized protein [Panulirus ornatus]|uniref:uncharacterized protein n=1 Tax=Panulirus ornatus TaxID=150431 RepID=UPI003A8A165F
MFMSLHRNQFHLTQEVDKLRAARGIVVLEADIDGQDDRVTQTQLSWMVSQAREMRQLSWCVTVVVVSDDPVFLATFAQWSLKGRLLVWSTRLLVLTRLPLQQLQDLHEVLSMTNAMLLIVEDVSEFHRCTVYIYLPYSARPPQAVKIATWTATRDLAYTSKMRLFPDKFSRLHHRPMLVVAAEEFEPHIELVPNADAVSHDPSFIGPLVKVLEILADTMNFTFTVRYKYVRPLDRSWGIKLDNGSWTGMVGNTRPPDFMWQRLVFASWMMMTLVLTRSYASNLMSYLAVRHIPQPYQTLREVLDDPSVTMIWEIGTSYVQYFRAVKSGIFREVADHDKEGLIKYVNTPEFYDNMDSLVREGDHVIITEDRYERVLMARDFSRKGRCEFYTSRERFLPFMSALVGPNDSPLVPVMSKRITSVTEAGLYDHWTETFMPNFTSCVHTPTKIAVNTSLSIHNLWVAPHVAL